MNKFEVEKDYTYVVDEQDKNSIHLKLLTGKYKDTTFKYGKVKIEEKDDNAYLQFDFDVIQSSIKEVDKTKEFRNYIGDLLVNIMMSNLGEFATNINQESYYDENRTDDIEESNL